MNNTEIINIRLEVVAYSDHELWMGVDETGSLYMTYSAVESILCFGENLARKKLASKKLKALFGEHLKVGKKSVRITNKPENFSVPKNGLVSAMAYEGFLQLVQFEVIEQNPVAINLVIAGLGDSLRSLALEHFGLAINAQQRNQWLTIRNSGKLARRELTDAIKSYLERHCDCSDNYRTFIYINASDALYRAVFGISARQLEQLLGCGRHQSRDKLDMFSLNRLNNAEASVVAQIDHHDIEPLQAIKKVIEFLRLVPIKPEVTLASCA
ncbi:hypothetical protein NIES23_61660 (plasmid) [Trichormus variabilis NIES-23]|uniref:Uncharacterized protein n=1 Tax=Trichormus variabilis NIES-23 TaxID=1973479 RepID=A0A1Z4KWN3_ANAVA|nr:hypothetical protein NIES23_61660 [Trichormus variabilis NIES-23]